MIVLAQNRCPLCGGRILHGECTDCGYRLPDEDKLSAPYNLDPEDDRPEPTELSPEKYKMPETRQYPEWDDAEPAEKAPNIKVMPTQTPFNNPYAPNNQQNNNPAPAQPNNQQNNQGWQNPYNYSPTQHQSGRNTNGTSSRNTQKETLAVLIVMLILSFFVPFFGVIGLIINGSLGSKLDSGTRKLFTILFIIAIAMSNIIGRS